VALLTTVLALDITTATTDSARLRAIANVMAVVVAVRATDLGLLDDLLLFRAELHRVTNLLAVGAVWLQTIHRETGILKTFEVLLSALGPAFGEDGTTRLKGLLEADLVLLIGVTLEVDVGVDLGGNSLLLGDEVVLKISLTEALLKLDESELRSELTVDPESFNEVFDITSGVSSDQVHPGLVGVGGVGKVGRVDVVLLGASGSGVASARALLADSLSTLRRAMTLGTTGAAGASEGALDLFVGAVGLVVTSLATVEALARHLTRFRALAREVTRLTTAVRVC
jgi:hypothetical protein